MGSGTHMVGFCPLCDGLVETFWWSEHYDMGSVTSCKKCKTEYDPKKIVDGDIGIRAALAARKGIDDGG